LSQLARLCCFVICVASCFMKSRILSFLQGERTLVLRVVFVPFYAVYMKWLQVGRGLLL
jgi:hypothetical protein